MANHNDSFIATQLINAQPREVVRLFAQLSDHIQDDAAYWNLLGVLWKAHGETHRQSEWLPFFQSSRAKSRKVMAKSERKVFDRLPSVVTAYRAINEDAETQKAISWTLSEEIATRLFSQNGKRKVAKRQFAKSEVFAYFNRRHEQEIIVNIKTESPL